MDRSLRSILWILVALVVLSSVTAGWFFITKERLYAAYTDLEGLFRATVERLNTELSSVTKENVELNAKLASEGQKREVFCGKEIKGYGVRQIFSKAFGRKNFA